MVAGTNGKKAEFPIHIFYSMVEVRMVTRNAKCDFVFFFFFQVVLVSTSTKRDALLNCMAKEYYQACCMTHDIKPINQRTAGPMDFPRPAGCLNNEHPRLSRLPKNRLRLWLRIKLIYQFWVRLRLQPNLTAPTDSDSVFDSDSTTLLVTIFLDNEKRPSTPQLFKPTRMTVLWYLV